MTFIRDWHGREREIADLFARVFAASEGPGEGELIGTLARDLMANTAEADIHVVAAVQEGLKRGHYSPAVRKLLGADKPEQAASRKRKSF